MTYHRLLAHKSWTCPKFLERLFVLFATIGMTGTAISWVAVHRAHHAYADTEKDPHNPVHRGMFWCHFLSMFAKVEVKFAVHLLRDKFYEIQHKHYFTINAAYALAVFLIGGPMALVYAWLVPAAILWNAGSAIVSISHRKGYPQADSLLYFLTWGEGYHDTHHSSPRLSRFGKWDLGGFIIKQIETHFPVARRTA